MKEDQIIEIIGNILEQLKEEEFPETVGYLSYLMEWPEAAEDPLEVADNLVQQDIPKRFPLFLIKFIEDLYLLAIEKGDDDAMNNLGAQYYDGGRGFEQDFAKAVHYYEMAAEHGNRQAQENLGYCHYYGRNMPVDYEKAYHYFALGALDGHLISLYKIGDMYLNGYYVRKNEKEAFCIFNRCIDTMTEESEKYVAGPVYLRLGKMYLNGIGTEKNAERALICYQKAEGYLYQMVKHGERMYLKSLQAAIDGQVKARVELTSALPEQSCGQ